MTAYDERLGFMRNKARKLSSEEMIKGQEVRDMRARSVPAQDRYRTAKRFSISRSVRERSRDQNEFEPREM